MIDGKKKVFTEEVVLKDVEIEKISGVPITATPAELNALVQGVASGYKISTGRLNLTATKFGIATGLTTISNVVTSFKKATAPSTVVNTSWTAVGGILRLYGWKYTNSTTNTLVAATSAASVQWTAIGA